MGKAIAAEMTPGVPGADVSSLEAKPCQRPQPPARVGTRCLRHWAGGLPTLFSLKRQQPQDCVFNCNTHISSPGRGCGVWGRKEARMPTFQAKGTRPPAGPSLPFASESSAFGGPLGSAKCIAASDISCWLPSTSAPRNPVRTGCQVASRPGIPVARAACSLKLPLSRPAGAPLEAWPADL